MASAVLTHREEADTHGSLYKGTSGPRAEVLGYVNISYFSQAPLRYVIEHNIAVAERHAGPLGPLACHRVKVDASVFSKFSFSPRRSRGEHL